MKQYLYIITSKSLGSKYVGKTTNYNRRKADHIYQLENHKHKNYLLQHIYDRFGMDDLQWEYHVYENISDDELNQKEIDLIEEYNSFYHGLNLTRGGDGGNTRNNRKLDFNRFCLAYFGCSKYSAMTNRLGEYLKVDSSTISAVVRKISYDDFRQQADELSQEEKDNYIQQFEKIMDLENKPPRKLKSRMTNELVFQIICVVSSHTTGIESTINSKFGISKGLMHRCFTKNNFQDAVLRYSKLSEQEVLELGDKYFKEWKLQNFHLKYRDLFLHYNVNRPDCGV